MQEKKKSNRKVIIVTIVIIALVFVIGVMGCVIYSLLNKTEEEKPIENRSASEGLVVGGNISEKKKNARFTTDMNMIWTFPSGSPVSTNAHIGNSGSNSYECYFEIYLDDENQKLLYSSQVLPVGTSIEQLKLDDVLPDGTYDALCTFHILDDENPTEELGKVSFNVSLIFGS